MNYLIDDKDEDLVVQKPKFTYGRIRNNLQGARVQTTKEITVLNGGSLDEKKSSDDSPQHQKGEEKEPDPPYVSELELRIQQKIDERKMLLVRLGLVAIKEEKKELHPRQNRQRTKQKATGLSHLQRSRRIIEKADVFLRRSRRIREKTDGTH